MQTQDQKGTNWVAVITMMFIYGMISFVTNLAAPMGNVWKYQPGIEGSNMLGMMGNMMNFLAYLFMGIPAGKMLTKCGYKKTAMIGIATGFVGVLIQFLSGKVPGTAESMVGPFCVYLLGAFVCGFSVCMLNMVVNPMLNLLGGGGNRGNQLNLIGTTFNSVCGTATPVLVGALIGEVSKATKVADVNLVMYIALAVFAAAFVVLSFIPIANPDEGTTSENVPVLSPLRFRHCLLGVIAIFMYVGIEIGIPGTMNLWLSAQDGPLVKAGVQNAATIAGMVAGTYWFLMLIGRSVGAFIGGKISSRILMSVTTFVAMLLIVVGVFIPDTSTTSMPVFTGKAFVMAKVPVTALLFALCGLCTSIMWPSTFNLATEKLGKYTAAASGLFMVMVVGGGVLPLVQNFIADKAGFMVAYIVPILALAYMFLYSAFFSKPPKDIDELVK
ncbi:MAG: sugar MFS transporter [Lentisphaerae bacterium]|jgi:FHS family L-fucose permease-like MFS transporter|nr:sugar MFS transporter [Lentisphaerota bacterium]